MESVTGSLQVVRRPTITVSAPFVNKDTILTMKETVNGYQKIVLKQMIMDCVFHVIKATMLIKKNNVPFYLMDVLRLMLSVNVLTVKKDLFWQMELAKLLLEEEPKIQTVQNKMIMEIVLNADNSII